MRGCESPLSIMESESPLPNRLKAGSPGLGEAASADIERRAIELAMMDGRDAFNDADLARAAADLAGGHGKPELPDEPINEDGHKIEPIPLEDDAEIEEQLIQDGVDEADHDRRASAAEDEEKERRAS